MLSLAGGLSLLVACHSTGGTDSSTGTSPGRSYPPRVLRLRDLVRQHPDSAGVRVLLAAALDSMGAFREAILQMDTLISKDSLNYGLWYSSGQILQDAGDTTAAMEAYARAIRIYGSPDALLSLANLYAEKKDPECLMICGRIRDMGLGTEYDAHCAFIAGVYNARTGNREQAIRLFDQCISSDFTYMEAYIEKGLVYFDSKRYPEALEVFRFASNVDHLFPDSYYWMARCYEMMGTRDSAILRFKQSFSLDPTLVEAQAGLKRLGAGN